MQWEGFHLETEGTGITAELSHDVNLLGSLLGHAIRRHAGEEIFQLVETLRTHCKHAYQPGREPLREQASQIIGQQSLQNLTALLRSFTAFFHLINQAEKKEIIRINREREKKETKENARTESIAQAIKERKESGISFSDFLQLLGNLNIEPTLTAHPTEARRRTIHEKQQQIASLLWKLTSRDLTPEEKEAVLTDIYFQISLLFLTDDVSAERPSVENEVENAVYFLSTSIWQTVPRLYRDIRNALRDYYEEIPSLPVVLSYRSWIGGDRDGNPNVTPQITKWTLQTHRLTALSLYRQGLQELQNDLSISARQIAVPDTLADSIEEDSRNIELDSEILRRYRLEPYRLKISYLLQKIKNSEQPSCPYKSPQFVAELELLQDSLRNSRLSEVADHGLLSDLIQQSKTFGFHLAPLDIRQHSSVHEAVVEELLDLAGVVKNYASLSENERLRILRSELKKKDRLVGTRARLSEKAASTLETFEVIREAIEGDPRSIRCYIVSMTHAVSDLLEVLLLAREAGNIAGQLDVVPLFETIDDLEKSADLMEEVFKDPVYREQLKLRGNFQEIMLGYSDSNKDGGFWMSNWSLLRAQQRLARVCVENQIAFRFFHGRGGSVGRGGGRANQAILAMPQESRNGRIRFTEQGEVISFRYALRAIAHRHLEQILHAMLISRAPSEVQESWIDCMNELASRSMEAYRRFVFDPALWEWYTTITPIEQISHLPIASRPVSRGGGEVDFQNIRAIPWVFAWTQTRYIIPGWFGTGTAFDSIIRKNPSQLETLREMYQKWPFFKSVLENAELEMARAHLPIAEHYSRLSPASSFHSQIKAEYEKARDAILQITGHEDLLENFPVIRKSIALRNPYTDVLNLIQCELLNRWKNSHSGEEKDSLRSALFLSINGIAAAMQSTG